MHRNGSDADLLAMAAQHLDTDAEALLRRYYGSPDDVRHELDELDRTGRLQPSLAQLPGSGRHARLGRTLGEVTLRRGDARAQLDVGAEVV